MKLRLLILFFFSQHLLANPIFFKCDSKGQMSEFLTGEEILLGLKKMQALLGGNKQKLFETLCQGRTECEKTLSQVLILTKISEESAMRERDELLIKLKGQMDASPIVKVTQEAFDLEKSIRDAAAEVAACRQTQIKLDPDQWEKNGCVTFYYPFKNEYTYASGYKIKNGKAMSMGCADPNSLRQGIRKALIMGVDPAVYFSLGLMEGGFNGYKSLYLDPIGVMRSLGCPETKSDVTKADKNKLLSYGNFHKIEPAVMKDAKLSKRLSYYLQTLGQETTPGKQYYCANVTGGRAVLKAKPAANECCLELGFKGGKEDAISSAMVQHYIYKMRFTQPYGSKDPAYKLQSFNGFSKLMGGAESVPVFRSGVDYTKTPAYGYQAMDYILNNLESNPWLVREIEAQKKELNLSEIPPSILCEGNPAGPYYIDSRRYFDLHRNSGRMTSILNKPYGQMTQRQKQVLDGEIDYMIGKGMFPEEINGKLVLLETFEPAKFGFETSNGKQGSVQIFFGLGTPGNTKKISEIITPEKLKEGFTFESDVLSYSIKPIGTKTPNISPEKLLSGISPSYILAPPHNLEYFDGSKIQVKELNDIKCFDQNNQPVGCGQLFSKNLNFKDVKVTDPEGNGFEVRFSKVDEKLKNGGNLNSGTNIPQYNKIIYNDSKDWVIWKNEVPDEVTEEKKASRAELASYYFKHLHKDRSTIEKASSYGPWKEITDEEIKLMVETPTQVRSTVVGGPAAPSGNGSESGGSSGNGGGF